MLIVTVEFQIEDKQIEAFRHAVLAQAANSLNRETACRQFDVCIDEEQPDRCFLYEKYDDRSAFDDHLASDHFQEFDSLVSPWIVAKTVRTWQQIIK